MTFSLSSTSYLLKLPNKNLQRETTHEDFFRTQMSLLWQLLIEMLSLFFEPTWLLDGVLSFLIVEFSFLQGTRLQENLYMNVGGICNFHF